MTAIGIKKAFTVSDERPTYWLFVLFLFIFLFS